MPSSEACLQSKRDHDQLKHSSARSLSLLLLSQESLREAPASEQVQDMLVLTGPAFKHPIGQTFDVHLPETCTSLYAQDAVGSQTKC